MNKIVLQVIVLAVLIGFILFGYHDKMLLIIELVSAVLLSNLLNDELNE